MPLGKVSKFRVLKLLKMWQLLKRGVIIPSLPQFSQLLHHSIWLTKTFDKLLYYFDTEKKMEFFFINARIIISMRRGRDAFIPITCSIDIKTITIIDSLAFHPIVHPFEGFPSTVALQ